MEPRILDAISSPRDLKVLTEDELGILANEIRQEIVAVTSRTGGHVASSLGAVEIILALHSLLDCPKDKIVFDVGHQAYAHKLVTGRLDAFRTLRQYEGLSGFTKPDESPYDVHYSGHASDSVSIAVGLAKARALKGTDEKIVAVIGDASLAGGMAFEALNTIGQAQLPLVIILNDNEMSISRNVGALVKHLGFMRATKEYRETRDHVQDFLEQRGKIGESAVNLGRNLKDSLKQLVIPNAMIFEQLGILCTAPIDGHDIHALRETLASVLEADGPVLVHVVTKKGHGYAPAEADPETFHGVGPYDIESGALKKKTGGAPSWTSVFGEALLREAEQDPDVVGITAAMKGGTGLTKLGEKFPDRCIDAGIAEENAVGMAAGLAFGGKKPVVAIYSTFMQRAIDQMILDNVLSRNDVVFALDRAGLVGDDGPTHHGVFDLVYARMMPGMRVFAPADEAELVHGLHTALALGGPFCLRYPRGASEGVPLPDSPEVLEPGVARRLREGEDVAILALGRMAGHALAAADILAESGIEARVVDLRWAKPLDRKAIKNAAKTKLVVTVEEGVVTGGVGEGILEILSEMGEATPTLVMGIPDRFVGQGKVDQLFKEIELDAEGIARRIKQKLQS